MNWCLSLLRFATVFCFYDIDSFYFINYSRATLNTCRSTLNISRSTIDYLSLHFDKDRSTFYYFNRDRSTFDYFYSL